MELAEFRETDLKNCSDVEASRHNQILFRLVETRKMSTVPLAA